MQRNPYPTKFQRMHCKSTHWESMCNPIKKQVFPHSFNYMNHCGWKDCSHELLGDNTSICIDRISEGRLDDSSIHFGSGFFGRIEFLKLSLELLPSIDLLEGLPYSSFPKYSCRLMSITGLDVACAVLQLVIYHLRLPFGLSLRVEIMVPFDNLGDLAPTFRANTEEKNFRLFNFL